MLFLKEKNQKKIYNIYYNIYIYIYNKYNKIL